MLAATALALLAGCGGGGSFATPGSATCDVPAHSSTFSAVNFEALNALGEGRYYDGIAATCPVAEDFSGQLGEATEKLTAAAASYLQNGVCPPVAAAEREQVLSVRLRSRTSVPEPGERRGMWAD